MKNILAWTHPAELFDKETATLVKIQIDNSLELGWSRDDILLYTNFPYEYNGVKSTEVSSEHQFKRDKSSNKILVIRDLLHKGLLKGLCWYHDFDAYQNSPFTEEDVALGDKDFGITGYGYKPQCNGGSFFFTETTVDIFDYWCAKTQAINRTRADEKSLTDMTRDGSLSKDRYKYLNITYNFGQRCPSLCWDQAEKPIKVLHFHPIYRYYRARYWNLDIFMYGKNPQGVPMMTNRLIKLFNKYNIK